VRFSSLQFTSKFNERSSQHLDNFFKKGIFKLVIQLCPVTSNRRFRQTGTS
ncbi:hypothetical protein X975_13456, partial [Stegodyphus mimosarum]